VTTAAYRQEVAKALQLETNQREEESARDAMSERIEREGGGRTIVAIPKIDQATKKARPALNIDISTG
jgi:hypothetical protein